MKNLKTFTRIYNAWRGLTVEPKDSFTDQHKLLSEMKVETIFDIGAHIGNTVQKYIKLFPEATVYAFEPSPHSFRMLQGRFSKNKLVKPFQTAVSNTDGKKTFYMLEHDASHSLLTPVDGAARWMYPDADENAVEVRDKIEVSVMKIDSFCKRQDISEIQILKMDIQGGELMALEGAKEKLRQDKIPLIYMEILFVPLYTNQAYYYNISSFLGEYGYSLFNIYDCTFARNGQIKWCDAIFISPSLCHERV